jgi:ribosome-binding factor A
LTKLTEHRSRIQELMAKSIVLKYTPVLKFVVDDSLVRGNRVMQILDELDKAHSALLQKPAKD